MDDFFPTDVSVRLDGDKFGAQMQRGAARQLLFKALLMAQASDGMPVQLNQRVGEADFISVSIIGDQKIVNIYAEPPVESVEVPVEEPEIPDPPLPLLGSSLYMLSGAARGPSQVTDGDGNHLLHDFAPRASTAKAYSVPTGYHDNRKLGEVVSTIQQYKSSLFSGSMKRIVQAIHGLGKIKDASGYYLTAPTGASRSVDMQYRASYAQTHGIYKAGPKNHWLIEISATRGVLAMPLPLIPSTKSAHYASHLTHKGDIGGLAVVNEFGGLPSGETFPTGTNLTNAITDGKVLRLLTASDLNPYYAAVTGETHSFTTNWAFADSGFAADNVRFNYKKIVGDPKYSVSAEHWSISIDLSKHNLHPPTGTPVGTGTATLRMLHSGRISKSAMQNFWGAGSATEQITISLQTFASLDVVDLPDEVHGTGALLHWWEGWGGIVHVFYDGDRRERVKYVPPYCLEYVDLPGGGYEYSTSIGGLISDSVDLRMLDVSKHITGPGSPNNIPRLFAIAPGWTREAIVMGRFRFELPWSPSDTKAYGIFSGLGIFGIECEQGATRPPWSAFPLFFGAVVNAGPTPSFNMTRGIYRQPQLVGLPSASPGYTSYNMPAGTGTITVADTNFIGGY